MVYTTRKFQQKRRALQIVFIVNSICASIALVLTCLSLYLVSDLLNHSEHVVGEVVELERGHKGGFRPTIQFKTKQGETLNLKSFLSTSPAPKLGDKINVVYRITNPHDWQIDDFIHLYFWAFLCGIFTASWSFALLVLKVVGDKQMRKLESSM